MSSLKLVVVCGRGGGERNMDLLVWIRSRRRSQERLQKFANTGKRLGTRENLGLKFTLSL
jgi:hypothetical protein